MFTATKIPPDLISDLIFFKFLVLLQNNGIIQLWPMQCLMQIVIQHTQYTTNINNSHEVHVVVLDIAPLPGAAPGGFLETGHVQIEIL